MTHSYSHTVCQEDLVRRKAVSRALTSIVFASAMAVACGGDDAPADSPSPTELPLSTPHPEPPTPKPYVPRDARITREVVQRLLPSPDATDSLLGISPGEWLLEAGIGLISDAGSGLIPDAGIGSISDESEALRLARSGITAGWIAEFRPGRFIYVSLFFHATPEDAERTYHHQSGLFAWPEERHTIADAVSMTTGALTPGTTTTWIFMRQQTVTAWVSLTDEDNQAGVLSHREFARMLALGIDEFVRTQGP